ncbi:Odz4 protein, partial [Caligus rogercresseyi]
MEILCWSTLFLAAFINTCNAHVNLNFPKGRPLNLDFLDSVRTPGPCGMPKGEPLSVFEAGTRLNVSWHLNYPHQ